MSWKLDEQLWTAASYNGELAKVKAAVESGADVNAYIKCQYVLSRAAENNGRDALAIVKYLVKKGADVNAEWQILSRAATSKNPDALKIVKYLVEQGANVNRCCLILGNAVRSKNPDTLGIVKYLVKKGADIHLRNDWNGTALTNALCCGKDAVADYLLLHDDFLPSDLIPRPKELPENQYKPFREKAIAHVVKLIGSRGLSYARKVAEDIGNIVKDKNTIREDIEALEPLIQEIRSMDWMNDAKVTSSDFELLDAER